MNKASEAADKYSIWRLCAWAGPIFMIGYSLSWGLLGMNIPPISPDISIGDLHSHYIDHNLRLRTAMLISVLFAPFYFVMSVIVSRVIQKIEGLDGPLSVIEQIGGTLTTVVMFVGGVCWLTASFRIDERTPEIIRLLHDFGWMFFDTTFIATNIQTCATGIAILRDKRAEPLYPRWLAWFSFAEAAIAMPVVLMPFFTHGPFAWNGLMNYWIGFSMFFGWTLLFSIYNFDAIKRLELEEATAN
jgi:hypothetical protein